MRFVYDTNASIPAGAWCALIAENENDIHVEVGRAVECNDDFFVQGVWDGDFAAGSFADTHFSCCTGGNVKISKTGGAIFSAPSHLLEAIYAIRKDAELYLSNSLAFVLERTGARLDRNYQDYQLDMCSSIFGIDRQIKSSPLEAGLRLDYYRCCNIEIDSSLNVRSENRQSGFSFRGYADYFKAMQGVMERLFSNAADACRKCKFGSMSTISRGYDAVASSVLARMQGCRRVLTFNSPRPYEQDCGSEIARRAAFSDIIEADANHYLSRTDYTEAECIASGDMGSAIVFAAHKDIFRNSVIFMGVRGDSLWERQHGNVNDRQDFTDGNTLQQTDHSFVETCLAVNAVCVPVPMIGADRWPDIARISGSGEMKPYSVRDFYDRPIARRMAEDYGIPREWFGRAKSGAGISYHFDTFGRILRKMSPASAESLREYRKSFRRAPAPKIRQQFKFYRHELPVYLNYLFSRLNIRFRIKYKKSYVSSPLSALLINWSVDMMRARYSKS